MLTLKMLKSRLDMPKEGERVPTWKELRPLEAVTSVQMKAGGKESEVAVYKNGYVLYRIGKRYTVFPINLEESYFYSSVTDECVNAGSESARISVNSFNNLEWHFPLILIGEDRLSHNLACRDRGRCISKEDMPAQDMYLGSRNYFNSEIEDNYILHEEVSGLLCTLNDLQRTIVHHVYWEGQTHRQAAKEMGYKSKSSVTNAIGRALKSMRKAAEGE
ncbi:MAG: hypothetical protein LUD14_05135 [Clostridiales bacterium]|nr:hypothetical protein [Clostridiales bacterium]